MTFDLIDYDRDILISTIELVNFMCHDHLVVNFKKKFTCIGGRNGSGKSAIMISLGILFGLRSSSLERGNSLKNLIKSGESFFIIRCVINNTKKFMYETFGDCIIVEKKVTTKSSTFSVVNKDRKVIFNKVDDLEYLLNFYDLKFDNPLNFLTQEMAKRFLSSSDPKVLYQLFLKATEISDIRTINEEYKNNVDIMKNKIEEVKKELELINDKIMDETKRLEILSNVGKLEKKIKDCNIEIEWSRIDKIRTEALVIQNELNEMSNEIKRKQDDLTSIMEESELIKQDKKNLNDENKLLQEKNAKRLEEVERDVNSKTIKIRSIEHDLEELQKEYAYKEDLIHKYELSNSFVDKRDVLYEQKNKTMTRINSLDERLNNLKYVCNKKESQRDQEIENQRNHEKNIYRIKKQLEFISKSGDQASMHPKIDVIVKEISSTKFRDIVIGPIGNYIKVKDQKWAKVVSILTHKILTNFICFNQNDRELLHSIFRKHNVSFSVQMPSSKMDKLIDYRSNKNYTTLLDVISVSSTIVLNQLIIMLSIERIVLMTSREKAYSVMKESPKYVDCIYLPYGDIVKKIGGSLSDFSSKRMERYYFENASDKKNDLQRELKALNDNKPSMSIAHEYDKLKNEIRDINMEKSELERLISKINNEIDNAEKLFATQKEIMSNENVYEDKKVIEKQIKVLENKIQKTKNEIQMLELEKEEIQNTSYRSVVDLDKQLIEKQTKFQRLNLEINNMIIKKLKIEQNYKNTMGSYESKRFELLEKYKEVVNPREECIVNDDIARLNTEVQEINKIGTAEDSEVARSHLIEAKKVKEQFLSLYQQKTENLLISLQSRIEKREYLKDHISKCATESFKQITSERGYSGDLIFDHTNESLFLKMKVHNLQVAGSKETLSGGERSFAAMSMLLSLWPHVSCPVKILDEFDVFMDNLNRKFVIEKFKSYFLSSNNQVILITPLNTNELAHPNIEIVSLKSPERKEAVPSG